jgi:hypothetical protein
MSGSLNIGKIIAKILGTYQPKPTDPPPPVIIPPVVIPPIIIPPLNLDNISVVSAYFTGGDHWESALQVPYLYKEAMPFINTVRVDLYDCSPTNDTPIDQQVANLNRLIFSIERDFPGKKYITSAYSTDVTDLMTKFMCFANVWDRLQWIEVTDEPADDVNIQHMCDVVKAVIKQLSLPEKPTLLNFTPAQILNSDRWKIPDIVSFEIYSDPPGNGDRNDIITPVLANAQHQLDKIGNKPFVIVPQAYSRNYDYTNRENLEAVLAAGIRFAVDHRPQCKGYVSFSYCRPSGARETGEILLRQLRRGMALWNNKPDPGPEPPGAPIPAPPPVGPGEVGWDKNAYAYPARTLLGTAYVQRYNGKQGRISVDYHTEDVLGQAGIDYIEQSGTLVFEDGEEWKTIQISVTGSKFVGHKEIRLKLTNPVNTKIGTPNSRIVVWSAWPCVEFLSPKVNGYAGNMTGCSIIRSEESIDTEVFVETVPISAVSGRDYVPFVGKLKFPATGTLLPLSIEVRPTTDPNGLVGGLQFKVKITSLTNGAVLGKASECLVTIQ